MTATGPVYNVPLIDTLPLGDGGFTQQMPSRDDLLKTMKLSHRVAAGYEVLLHHYRDAIVDAERCRKLRANCASECDHDELIVTLRANVPLGSFCPWGDSLDQILDAPEGAT